jgi:glycosyltransferase involved in cell wall biosynthesis
MTGANDDRAISLSTQPGVAVELSSNSANIPAVTENGQSRGVSVVVPIYNEQGNILRLHQELSDVLTGLERPYEIVFVDDGSKDGSVEILREIASRDSRSKLVIFRRNYGQTSAMQAGIDHATMGVIVTIDGDLQNDPADITEMLAKLEEGYDLVHGWRKDRKDALVSRKIPSRIANWLIAKVTRFPIHDLGCTLKVMRREILQEVELYGEMHHYIPILLYQRGARCAEVSSQSHSQRIAAFRLRSKVR